MSYASRKCGKCNKTVYQAEWIQGLDQYWHKNCFRCENCKKAFAALSQDAKLHKNGNLYCKKCHEDLFGIANTVTAARVISSTESSFVREGAFSRPEFAKNRVPSDVNKGPSPFTTPVASSAPKAAPPAAAPPAAKPVPAPVPVQQAPVVQQPPPVPVVEEQPAPVGADLITVQIHDTASEQEMPLEIPPVASIGQVKDLVSQATGIPHEGIILGFNEQELTDELTLDILGIGNGATILAIFPQ